MSHAALKVQLKALEEQSKQLSRKIGEAKKAGLDTANALIIEKQTLQKELIAPLKAQIKNLAEQSASATSSPSKAETETDKPFERASYPDTNTNAELGNISITLIENFDQLSNTWDEYIRHHPQHSIYHTQIFLSTISHTFGHKLKLLIARDKTSNSIIGLVPLIEQKSPLFGHLWTSIPFVNYGGILADNAVIEKELLEKAKNFAFEAGVKQIEIRGLYQRPCDWKINTDKASMWLRLPSDSDTLLNSFKAKLRSQINKGYTEHVSVRIGKSELLSDFYTVFSRNMRDLGTPVYSSHLFKNILGSLTANAHIVMVYFDGKPASCAFLIRSENRMEIPWASTIREYNQHNLNMVLYWEVLKLSCQDGCEIFDFGRSSIDASTYRFKKQWGAVPIQHYWYSNSSNAQESTGVNPNNPKYKLMINAWQRLPLWLANFIGPHIVKYIP
jgi:FemAB-related protein (PEP-CTERM system-associated)